MHTVTMKKKDDNIICGKVDVLNIARGHIIYPKAGRHKDRRRVAKTQQRVNFSKEWKNG